MPATNSTQTEEGITLGVVTTAPTFPTCGDCDNAPEDGLCENCENCGDCCECRMCAYHRCSEGPQDPDDICERCERCETHCECQTCGSCSSRCESTCSNCDECESCCECHHCDRCNEPRSEDSMCHGCDRCNNCGCRCSPDEDDEDNESSGPVYWKHKLKFWKPVRIIKDEKTGKETEVKIRHQCKRNPSPRVISVEIEVAKYTGTPRDHIGEICRKWGTSSVPDGSIGSGFELNTAPAGGDLFIDQIEEICKGLKGCRGKVTRECGTHVHVDARDLKYWDIRRLTMLYAHCEEALFGMVSKSRSTSSYCLKCGPDYARAMKGGFDPRKLKDALAKAVYKEGGMKESASRRKQKYDSARYAALNLHSWFFRGTVECRMHNGTVDAKKIVPWGMLWADLVDWSATHTDKDLDTLVATKSGYETLLAVAVADTTKEYIKYRTAHFKFDAEAGENDE